MKKYIQPESDYSLYIFLSLLLGRPVRGQNPESGKMKWQVWFV